MPESAVADIRIELKEIRAELTTIRLQLAELKAEMRGLLTNIPIFAASFALLRFAAPH